MKKILFLFLFVAACIPNVIHARMLPETERQACEKLLRLAEKKQIDKVYDICGFNDEDVAWYQWAPQMSAEENKKALYELCRRHPTHEYAHLYCQKSADLEYLPAFYWLAKEAQGKNEKGLYKELLDRIIAQNDIKDKKQLLTDADFAARSAYEDLARIYLEDKEHEDREKGLNYLQIAADAGSPSAAHTLGVLLSWNPDQKQQELSKKYLWKAILLGCPAAEENLGLMSYLKQKRLYPEDAKEAIEGRMYSCQPSAVSPEAWQKVLKVEDCPCSDVMAWFKKQQKKPFLVVHLDNGTAVLEDPTGYKHSVTKGDKVIAGFVVEDVRPTAVIVRRPNERYVLNYREDAQCVDLCVNPNVIPKHYVKNLPPYELKFTSEECQNLAEGIENLNNPLSAFRGLPECQLQDWKKWGDSALKNKQNKQLFLLANYERSDYIPSFVATAELMINDNVAQNAGAIESFLTKAIKGRVVDELSAMKKEQAYCMLTKVYMDAKLYKKAFALAQEGSSKKYPQSTNMLGVLYATGYGTTKDLKKAEELFLQADEESSVPFVGARQNYKALNGEATEFVYGQCQNIIGTQSVSIEKLLELY